MALTPGTRLGPYEISAQIGVGGMGEVYRARDTKLNRDVAIKILPDSFATDPDRLARFTREAQVLASLNHPNIAHIHGLEESNGVRALVMELVEGEDLAQRIARGAIPLDEALPIAKQIAEALEAAHEHGIIHRDLKPANIKVRPDGTVKVLDFGLAKAMDPLASSPEVSRSPTITTPAVTHAGIVLGTAAYMSPEQAKGKPLDKRTDVWAFGCVLYEVLAGVRAFDGDDVSDTMASVLKSDPDWERLPAGTPTPIRTLLRRCLTKDRKRRLADIADARIEIEEAIIGAGAAAPTARTKTRWMGTTLAIGIAVLVGALAGRALTTKEPEARNLTRASVSVAPADRIAVYSANTPRPSRTAFAISPDGRIIVFSGTRGAETELFKRPLDQAAATPMDGTIDATSPVFSPDGQWIAFAANGKLRKVPTAGGPTTDIADLGVGKVIFGLDWGQKETIAFSIGSAILRVPSSGGTPETVVSTDPGQRANIGQPHWLPGERGLFYTEVIRAPFASRLLVLPQEGTDARVVVDGATDGRFVATGHLLYMKNGALVGAPFDLAQLRVTGTAVTLVDDVMHSMGGNIDFNTGAGQFAVGLDGTLVYALGGVFPDPSSQMVWVNRRGEETSLTQPPAGFYNLRLSPDGRRLAYARTRPGSNGVTADRDIWVYDLERSAPTRLTLTESYRNPLWAPDGQSLVFSDMSNGGLYTMAANGNGVPEHLNTVEQKLVSAASVTGDGLLAFVAGAEIWTVPLNGSRKPELFLKTPYTLSHPVFSPDGRWIAYCSEETGRSEVYVQSFPNAGQKTPISVEGGSEPVWARSGRELFYTEGFASSTIITMMVTDIDTKERISAGRPRRLFSGDYFSLRPTRAYDVSADGQRFIMAKNVRQDLKSTTQIEIVLNWTDELRRRIPAH